MIGLLGFAVVWGVVRYFRRDAGETGLLLCLWWLVVTLSHAPVLPPGNPIAALTGGDFRGWVVFGILGALVLAWRAVLRRLRPLADAASAPAPAAAAPAFRPAELDRYARHIMLREIGGTGQRRLRDARVLVVGAGGLGSPAILYLAAAGVGTIGVIDDDVVENANLQRQVLHTDARIGMPKVQSAQIAAQALNPFVTLRPYNRRLDATSAAALFADYDLVLDGSDNFDTREVVNRAAVAQGLPVILGALTQWEGQVTLLHPAAGAPCYACLFPDRPAPGLVPTCAEAGVAGPLPGVIGAMMALEAVKHLTGAGQTLAGRLMLYDGLEATVRTVRVARRKGCAVCGG
jgi:molybdopterin/thiamine biosynthesis adenylyltransferase